MPGSVPNFHGPPPTGAFKSLFYLLEISFLIEYITGPFGYGDSRQNQVDRDPPPPPRTGAFTSLFYLLEISFLIEYITGPLGHDDLRPLILL